jgi:pimeloyl-ACP methyl ester carboxylesterase
MLVNRFGPEGGPPVLLLHGGGVAGWMWDSLRQSLEQTRSVLVPDLPGHGGSAGEPYRSHTETVDELARVLAQHGTRAAAVIGFSLGAQLVGRRERALMRDSAAAVHAALPGSELEAVAGCGHGIPLQRPEWFDARVADWLSR